MKKIKRPTKKELALAVTAVEISKELSALMHLVVNAFRHDRGDADLYKAFRMALSISIVDMMEDDAVEFGEKLIELAKMKCQHEKRSETSH